jgi:hypothetical protein
MAINIKSLTENNAVFFTEELGWLSKLIGTRLRTYFEGTPAAPLTDDEMPVASSFEGSYAGFILSANLELPDRILLALSLAPYIDPKLLDVFTTKNSTLEKKFAEFGGKYSGNDAFIPTIETALFILAGNDLGLRFKYYQLLSANYYLISSGVLNLQPAGNDEPLLNASLQVSAEYLDYFITGHKKAFGYSDDFPARPVTTGLNWADYVTTDVTLAGINEVKDWINHGESVLAIEGLRNRLKPGYKVLFHGPPGTGKTLAATLLGKSTGHDVYRIDLSRIVSKYIGETEKSLAKVFDRAESKKWILFFDEADALFGKRTEISNSNDRFANQEVAYLLQRIEEHNGLVVLATNLKDNIDKAFLRRFQSVIYFPLPSHEQRIVLWQQSFTGPITLNAEINWNKIAQDHTLSGAAIVNVVRYCYIQAMKREVKEIFLHDIYTGIKKELHKEGIIF